MSLRSRFDELAARAARKYATAGSVTLVSRRIYILPTGSGFFFAFIVGATLIGSLNYQSSLGFLFTFLLASIGLVSMVETQRNLTGLTLEVAEPQPVFAGEQLRIVLTVRSGDGRKRSGIGGFANGGETALFQAGGEPFEVALTAPPRPRGVGEVGRVTLETGYPLGLFRAWSPVESGARVLVYPFPHPGAGSPPAGGGGGGGEGAQGGERGNSVEDFYGLRDFIKTDPPSRVNWKTVARSGALTVKEFEASAPIYASLNYDDLKGSDPETRLSILCAWTLTAFGEGSSWSLTLPDFEIPRGSGKEHLRRTLEALAAFRP